MQNSSEKILKVKTSKEYDVIVKKGLLSTVGERLLGVTSPCKVAIITDDVVDKLYSNVVVKSLKESSFEVVKFVFPHGEGSKNLNTFAEIVNFLAENQLTRTDLVIALGGGVVGDITGFSAATYLRGIKYVQIPTTLLSQVDSSIGGKTAVDLDMGKNLVGAFKQPSLVLCDVDTLKSLPEEVYLDGMGEVLKYAILDKKVFDLLSSDNHDLVDLIYLCLDYKRRVVEIDEFEKHERKLLNLGHTPAHAIEKLSKYQISHGVAVGMGLKIILDGAKNCKIMSDEDYKKIVNALSKYGVLKDCPYSKEQILSAVGSDKKRSANDISLVIPKAVGEVEIIKVPLEDVKEYI